MQIYIGPIESEVRNWIYCLGIEIWGLRKNSTRLDVLQDDIEPPPKIVVFLIANFSIVLFLVLILLKIVN
jgi:hypothetical protein